MPKSPRRPRHPFDDAISARTHYKAPPHEFVLDALASLSPSTRVMFGCLAIYVEDKIVLILRDRTDSPSDNGVLLATSPEHHESLRREFPHMRSIKAFGKKVTSWQVLAVDTPDFEEAARRACELVRSGDPRIGKSPKRRVTAKRGRTVAGRARSPSD